ncbi:MAG TPA: response regulator transcription factor [Ktedonobacterales bacterium]|nr:response regulator transcription factor [Ktedonobacterales bacterium]
MQRTGDMQPDTQEMIRIMLVDDHAVMRAGTRRFLEDERDFLVVGEASDGDEALALAEHVEADVVLLDINLPRVDGVKTARLLKQRKPTWRIVILTGYNSEAALHMLHRIGVEGYLMKTSSDVELVAAIRSVMDGNTVLSSDAANTLEQASGQEPSTLTPKELDVLRALARGLKNKDIADELSISVHTVEYHVHNLFLKLNAISRADVLMRAQRYGWLDMAEPLC